MKTLKTIILISFMLGSLQCFAEYSKKSAEDYMQMAINLAKKIQQRLLQPLLSIMKRGKSYQQDSTPVKSILRFMAKCRHQ